MSRAECGQLLPARGLEGPFPPFCSTCSFFFCFLCLARFLDFSNVRLQLGPLSFFIYLILKLCMQGRSACPSGKPIRKGLASGFPEKYTSPPSRGAVQAHQQAMRPCELRQHAWSYATRELVLNTFFFSLS